MSRKVTLPETSLAAYDALQPDQLREMYNKIVAALKVLGSATYEELSDYLHTNDRNAISRRLKEMCPKESDNPKGLGLIYRTSDKRLTKRQRQAFVYKINEGNNQNAIPEKLLSGKSIVDFSMELIQKELF